MQLSAETKICGKFELFAETLRSIRPESTACIVSCLTNFIAEADGSSVSVSSRVEPILLEVRDVLLDFCEEQPDRLWLISPPMYRLSPVWLLDGMSEIMLKFSEVMSCEKPRNLLLLPSFPTPCLESDGIHLTPYSGLQFIVHLFDVASEAVGNLKKTPNALISIQSESIRSLEDRMTVIEQDHRRLNSSVELKAAVSSENSDFSENLRL